MVAPRSLRVVFFGTPTFAVPTLDALLASHHPVVAVVTQPDRPRGRGQRTSAAPVKARAEAMNVPVLQPSTLKDPGFLSTLAQLDADIGIVAAYGKILTETVLSTPRLGLVNVHASLLPKYRGAAPIHRAIIAGERETGVTIMQVVKALDAGPMLAKVRLAIGPDVTSAELEGDLARLGAPLLVSTVDQLAAGEVHAELQEEAEATYASRLAKGDGVIDWSAGAERIHNQIRGLHPWPHAYTFLTEQRLILLRSAVVADAGGADGAAAGTITAASGDDLQVACGAGRLRILRLQAEGARPMDTRDFLAGHPLTTGRRFTSAP